MVKDCPPDRRPNDTFQIALRAAVTAVGGGEYEPVPARTAMVGGEREEAAGKKTSVTSVVGPVNFIG
ncbi:hypothetical protein RB195_003967 [Necator americanus]|uniref:Uncharacterized protein n=1 Tax=Necator americanus TaxID=51031 RepID=A0ABR1DR44_NECAM